MKPRGLSQNSSLTKSLVSEQIYGEFPEGDSILNEKLANDAGKLDIGSPNDVKLFELIQGAFASPLAWKASKPQNPPSKEDVLETAAYHAVAQFVLGLDDGSVDEEHSSAALMGFFGGCVNIYNLLSLLSGGEQTKILWNIQKGRSDGTVQSESVTGGDFGIVFPVDTGKTYRLAFFQAKKEKRQDGGSRFDIGHVSGKYARKLNADETKAAEEYNGVKVDENLKVADEKKGKTEEGRAEDARLMTWFSSGCITDNVEFHQILKLAHTQFKGWDFDEKKPDWVHYVIWPVGKKAGGKLSDAAVSQPKFSDGFPLAASIESVRKNVGNVTAPDLGIGGISDHKNPVVVWEKAVIPLESTIASLKCPSFLDVLRAGIRGEGGGWLTVSSDDASALIGKISTAGSEWVVLSDKGSSLLDALRKNGFAVSLKNPEVKQIADKLKNQLTFTIRPGLNP